MLATLFMTAAGVIVNDRTRLPAPMTVATALSRFRRRPARGCHPAAATPAMTSAPATAMTGVNLGASHVRRM
jgi:hypothetical protein